MRKNKTCWPLQTLDLERRVAQIRTAAEIASTMGAILDPDELLQNVADLIRERFDLYYVGIFMVDENRRYANLVAGTGEAGRVMMANNHQLSIGGSSMVGWAVSHGEPRISLDVGTEAIRFQNPNRPRPVLSWPSRSGQASKPAAQSRFSPACPRHSTRMTSSSLRISPTVWQLRWKMPACLASLNPACGKSSRLNRQYTTDSWQNIWAEEESSQAASAERGSTPAGAEFQEVESR